LSIFVFYLGGLILISLAVTPVGIAEFAGLEFAGLENDGGEQEETYIPVLHTMK